jgi:hypothetical protein
MNAWTVLVAGLLGTAVAVARIMRRQDRTDRHLRLGGVALGGVLIALVALRAENLPVLVVLVLVGLSVLAGVWFRPCVVEWRAMPWVRCAVPIGRTPFVVPALAVVIVALVWPGPEPPTAEERDTARFGVRVHQHRRAVPNRVLDHTPTATDVTDRHLATAVPVERYAHDGRVLTLVVRHSALCGPVEVLLAPAGTNLEVFVVFAPQAAVASAPSTASDHCRIDPSDIFARHTAIEVKLPAGSSPSGVTDVGAGGPALVVSAPPAR